NFAVMHPPSMAFKPLSAQAFTSPGLAQGLRVEQAVNKPVRDLPAFKMSGIGLATPAQATGVSSQTSPVAAAAKPDTPASVMLPVDPDRPEDRVWVLLSGIAALLTAIAYLIWKKRKRAV
ncbi:MAG TPA: LPXTG cell wall anchor domain-containing protein, partial [Candidatus Angelobacter sp.]